MQKLEKWTERYNQLSKADQDQALGPEDLEKFATAAYLTGKDIECIEVWGRAHQVYLAQGRVDRAVRCTFWLGMIHINRGDKAQGSGWITRGNRLLDQHKLSCPERGLLQILLALGALSRGDMTKAKTLFDQAVSMGEAYNDADLKAISRLGYGQLRVGQGDATKGIRLLDEAMIMVEAEDVHLIAKGIIYCAVISICRRVWDMNRAQEWTSSLSRWCKLQPDLVPFRGQCLVRRAEIMQLCGEWPEAMKEAKEACSRFQSSLPSATGEAYYLQAELHRLMGTFEKAEDCYREAAKWGRKPQPGLALLRLAQGQNDAAETSIRNTLQETKDAKKRAEILPAVVMIMVAVKQTDEAFEAAKELSDLANRFNAAYLYAMSYFCQGASFLGEGNVLPALDHLQNALKYWNTLHLPYETARTRELKGLIYLELNDKDNSDAELANAKWIFEQLNAIPDMERINRLLSKKRHYNSHGLTLRELQVLHEVVSGKTNKSIARELFISERTVDRHVSNIFNKLAVSSRVAAVTFAIKNKLLDSEL